jgi:hypothetical protein
MALLVLDRQIRELVAVIDDEPDIVNLVSLLIPLISFRLIKTYFVDALTENLKNVAIGTSPQIASFLDDRRHKDPDVFLKNLKNKINARITVIDKEGTVLADTEKPRHDGEPQNEAEGR